MPLYSLNLYTWEYVTIAVNTPQTHKHKYSPLNEPLVIVTYVRKISFWAKTPTDEIHQQKLTQLQP